MWGREPEWGDETEFLVPALPLASCVTLGTLLGFSVPEFSLGQRRQYRQCGDSGRGLWNQAAQVHISALSLPRYVTVTNLLGPTKPQSSHL